MENARELSSRLLVLLRREQGAMADFLLALADFDRSRAWVALGYTSLFYYLHRELKLSAGAAFHRKTAAELIQRFSEVREPLRDGRLCLSSVCELAKVMTPENAAEVLPRFFHASKQEAKAVAAELAPAEVVPQRAVVTPVASSATHPQPRRMAAALELGRALHPGETPPTPIRAEAPAATPRSVAEPLTADLRRLHVTVSKRFMDKLEAARDALSHSHPGADVETILEVGLDLVLERAAKRKGLVKRPRSQVADPVPEYGNPRKIPAAVRREVFLRDGGRCQWPTADGGICGSTHRVELDHIIPVARGGKSTVANLRILCCAHNHVAARQVYGDEFMNRFTRSKGVNCRQAASPR
jgi:5-methylcytosine-specific restriction endonuclease McrA